MILVYYIYSEKKFRACINSQMCTLEVEFSSQPEISKSMQSFLDKNIRIVLQFCPRM